MLVVLVLALAQLAATDAPPAPAQAPATQEAPAQQTTAVPTNTAVNPDQVLHCRWETEVGSHIPVRHCSTPAQDRARALHDQEMLHRIEQHADTVTPSGLGH